MNEGSVRAAARPSGGALFGACLWAAGLVLVGTMVGVAMLVVLAQNAPVWYRLSAVVIGGVGYLATLGGLGTVRVPWLRWRLLGIATGAVIVAALLTIIAL